MDRRFELSEEFAHEMDRKDDLKEFRNRFYLLENQIYMDGNSLGLMSKDAEQCLLRVMDEWKRMGINVWTKASTPLFYYAEKLSKQMAPLVGAEEDEVIIHSSTTINIHTAIATFYRPDDTRNKILIDELNFPTDRYAVESQIKLKGLNPEDVMVEVKSRDGRTIREEDVIAAMTDDVAIAFLPSVLYRSGQLLDMAYLTQEAQKRGIIIGFDLSHSAGAVPHQLSEWGVDFAVWCNYKYLNGGPGSAAAIYINRKHFNREPGLAGWHGYVKTKQFDLLNEFEAERNAGGWQTGTTHVFSLAPIEGALAVHNEAGMVRLRDKSLHITAYLMNLIDELLSTHGFAVGTPRDDHGRGGHVALEHEEAVRINEALKDQGVIPDFRFPNVIRLAPVPLYTQYHDVWRVVQIIKKIMEERLYENYSKERGVVA
jgi:kynureninase